MKTWTKPTFNILSSTRIRSANMQTQSVFEIIDITVENTCTFNGADCTTLDGMTYDLDLASGFSPNAFGPGNPGALTGLISTCNPNIQCS